MSSTCSIEECIHECKDYEENKDVINGIRNAKENNTSQERVSESLIHKSKDSSENTKSECANHSNNFKIFMDNKATTFEEEIKHMETWSTKASIADVVCLGATAVIVIIQLCVLVFYVFKDHETEENEP